MSNQSLSNIYLSAFLSTAATGGGWAITDKLAGQHAALSFLYISAPIVLGMLVIQVLLFLKSRTQAKFLILLNIASAFGLLWMLLSLVLPIFWIDSIGAGVKIVFATAAIFLFYSNIVFGVKKFDKRWANIGAQLLGKYYKRDSGEIDWGGVVGSLKLSVSFRVPGLPEKINPILSVTLVMSMLAGLSLRTIFPVFSVFAWSIPSVIVIATFLQMTGFTIGQFFILVNLEKKEGVTIRLM